MLFVWNVVCCLESVLRLGLVRVWIMLCFLSVLSKMLSCILFMLNLKVMLLVILFVIVRGWLRVLLFVSQVLFLLCIELLFIVIEEESDLEIECCIFVKWIFNIIC